MIYSDVYLKDCINSINNEIARYNEAMLSFETVVIEQFLGKAQQDRDFDCDTMKLTQAEKDYLVYSYLNENKELIADYFGSESVNTADDIYRLFNLTYKGIRAEVISGLTLNEDNAIHFLRAKVTDELLSLVLSKANDVINEYLN